jgi:leader peptidase (prepilin peptidase) / N-methyltransferase
MIPVSLFLFLFGLIIGSFLNVLGLRWNSGVSPTKGRSFCVVCQKELRWWELIPVVSFVGLRGRCSECKTGISWQYPLVELCTGLIFASLYLALRPTALQSTISYVLTTIVFCIYIVITIYDARHKIIPDSLVYASTVLALGVRIIMGGTLLDWLSGPILFSFFALIWVLSKGRAMGFGDAKLALSIGLLLGAPIGFSSIVLAFWIGSVISLIMLLMSYLGSPLESTRKKLTMKSEVPFAPFMILGAWTSLVYSLDLFHVLTFTN